MPAGEAADSRLSLLEYLIGSVDLAESAKRAMEWLSEHTPIEQALVAAIETGSRQLIALAAHDVAPTAVAEFSLNLADEYHPIIAALHAPEATYIDRGRLRTPIDGSA